MPLKFGFDSVDSPCMGGNRKSEPRAWCPELRDSYANQIQSSTSKSRVLNTTRCLASEHSTVNGTDRSTRHPLVGFVRARDPKTMVSELRESYASSVHHQILRHLTSVLLVNTAMHEFTPVRDSQPWLLQRAPCALRRRTYGGPEGR